MDRKDHWEHVYNTKTSDQVSWFQAQPATSLALLEGVGLTAKTWIIDVGGGDSRLVDSLLARGLSCVSVLDVSGAALARAKARLGTAAHLVRWIDADVTSNWIADPVDFWHDRAVFHFLTEANDRALYVERARNLIRPGGHLVLAAFAPAGPTKCSGLPVVRYDAAGLANELGSSFTLEHAAQESHTTPAGAIQPFTYAVFRFKAERSTSALN